MRPVIENKHNIENWGLVFHVDLDCIYTANAVL